jgi:transcriptional regulator with XRE-family HTH domain
MDGIRRRDGTVARKRHRLAERRRSVGLSQERLAEILGVDRSTVVRWERAETDPQPWQRPRLARALRLSVEQLAERLDEVGPADGLLTVTDLRERVQRLDSQYDQVPSTGLLAEAGELHGLVVARRNQATNGRSRRELLAVEAASARLLGQLVWDASQRRDHTTANRYLDHSIAAAAELGDAVAVGRALLRRSFVSLYGSDGPAVGLALATRAALASAGRGNALPGRGNALANAGRSNALAGRSNALAGRSNALAGLALLHVGEAYAMLGDAKRCAESLGAAQAHLDRIAPDDPAADQFCPSQHGRLTGSCLLYLGRPDLAESILDSTRRRLTEPRKSTAVLLGHLALAGIRRRDLEAAVTRMHEAIDVVGRTRAGGGLTVVVAAARELGPWRDEPAVRDVHDRLLDLVAP